MADSMRGPDFRKAIELWKNGVDCMMQMRLPQRYGWTCSSDEVMPKGVQLSFYREAPMSRVRFESAVKVAGRFESFE